MRLALRAASALIVLALASGAAPAEALRVMTYNLLNYSSGRENLFRSILTQTQPDVVVVEEILSQSAVNRFRDLVLNQVNPGEWEAASFVNGPDTDNALFFRSAEIDTLGHFVINTALRQIDEWTVRPSGQTDEAKLRIYSLHLKASQGTDNEQKRLAEVTAMRQRMETFPVGENYLIAGDFNIYRSTEPAYQYMIDPANGLAGVVEDPISREGNWHSNSSFADVHTQSPRTLAFGGGANGGMDDRFDLILSGPALRDDVGLEILESTYTAFGQDGLHFNTALNQEPYVVVDSTTAQTIHDASDHLPVFVDFEVLSGEVGVESGPALAKTGLISISPNPFAGSADIRFGLTRAAVVELTVYDVRGRVVQTLESATLPPGEHQRRWAGRGGGEAMLAPGVYFVHFRADDVRETRKLVHLR